MSAQESSSPTKGGSSILHGKLLEMTDLMNMHIGTSMTQLDIREEILTMIAEQISQMISEDLTKSI